MKKLLKVLVLSVGLLSSSTWAAGDCSSIKHLPLNDTQKTVLQKQCLDMALIKDTPGVTSLDDVEVLAGKADVLVNTVSRLLKTTAKDLNIAVNEFVTTPVGIMTAGVIIYHYLGKDFIIWVKDVVVMTIFLILSLVTLGGIRKRVMLESTEEKEVKGWFGGTKVVTVNKYKAWGDLDYSDGGTQAFYVLSIIAQVLTVIIFVCNI